LGATKTPGGTAEVRRFFELVGLSLTLVAAGPTGAQPRAWGGGGRGRPAPGGPTGSTGSTGSAGSISLLGVRLDRLTAAEAATEAFRLISEAGGGDEARLIFTPNPEMIFRARRNAAFRDILNSADLSVADGIGVVWGARFLGTPLPERVAGYDLLGRLIAGAGTDGHEPARRLRVFLLGSAPGVAREAAERIEREDGAATVVGEHHGFFTDDGPVLRAVLDARPDLLVVGLGSPKQEMWLARHRKALAGLAAMGVGGSLDVLSGRTRRAPERIRRLNLEWLYRIVSQPRARLKRVPALAGFVLAVTGEALARALWRRR
jgi:N-acetylglucosaminyldiphosphoundecaprenol N-acetyl-beta-D-mannosaminyltransferase